MKGKIVEIKEIQGNKGKFWAVKADENGHQYEMLCFDGQIVGKQGQEIEYERREKNDKYYLNFPKTSGGGGGRKVDSDAMYVAYGKDLAICFLENKALPFEEDLVDKFIGRRFAFFKLLTGSKAEVKAEDKPTPKPQQTSPALKPNPEYHRGEAVKCPETGGKLRSITECENCDGKVGCFAWI